MGTVEPITLSPWVRLLLLLFPLPFILAGAVMLFIGVRSLDRARRSVDWPPVSGVVREAAMEFDSGGEGSAGVYDARIRYEFDVDGTVHSGDRVSFGDYSSSFSSHAKGIVNRYPEGKEVTVYYMPENPDVCVLEPGIKAQVWFLPVGGLVFLVVGLLMAVFLPILARLPGTVP